MATAKEFRARIIECAKEAQEKEPTNVEYRLHCFVARLAGSMAFHGEEAAETELRKMLGLPVKPRSDGA